MLHVKIQNALQTQVEKSKSHKLAFTTKDTFSSLSLCTEKILYREWKGVKEEYWNFKFQFIVFNTPVQCWS